MPFIGGLDVRLANTLTLFVACAFLIVNWVPPPALGSTQESPAVATTVKRLKVRLMGVAPAWAPPANAVLPW